MSQTQYIITYMYVYCVAYT